MDQVIVCPIIFDARCGGCQRLQGIFIKIPMTPKMYKKVSVRDMVLGSRESPRLLKVAADQLGCSDCGAADFEVGEPRRALAYRDGDEMRLLV